MCSGFSEREVPQFHHPNSLADGLSEVAQILRQWQTAPHQQTDFRNYLSALITAGPSGNNRLTAWQLKMSVLIVLSILSYWMICLRHFPVHETGIHGITQLKKGGFKSACLKSESLKDPGRNMEDSLNCGQL